MFQAKIQQQTEEVKSASKGSLKRLYTAYFWDEQQNVNSFAIQRLISMVIALAFQKFAHLPKAGGRLLFSGYIRTLLRFTPEEKEQTRVAIPFLYSHYDNWSPTLERLFAAFQTSDISFISKKCQNESDKKTIAGCYQHGSDLNLVYQSCGQDGKLIDNANCFSRCPDGFQDSGLYCIKPKVIVRKLYKDMKECGPKCNQFSTFRLYIRPCPQNYREVLTFCIPVCSYGFEDHGKSCKKIFINKVSFYF